MSQSLDQLEQQVETQYKKLDGVLEKLEEQQRNNTSLLESTQKDLYETLTDYMETLEKGIEYQGQAETGSGEVEKLKLDIVELSTKLQNVEIELKQKEHALDIANKTLREKGSQFEDGSAKLRETDSKLEEAQRENQSLISKVSQLEEELRESSAKHSSTIQEKEQVVQEREQHVQEKQQIAQEKEEINKEVLKLKGELEYAENAARERIEKIKSLTQREEELSEEKRKLEEQVQQLSERNTLLLEEHRQDLITRQSIHSNDIASKTNEITTLASENQALKNTERSLAEEVRLLKNDHDKARGYILSAIGHITNTQQRLENLINVNPLNENLRTIQEGVQVAHKTIREIPFLSKHFPDEPQFKPLHGSNILPVYNHQVQGVQKIKLSQETLNRLRNKTAIPN